MRLAPLTILAAAASLAASPAFGQAAAGNVRGAEIGNTGAKKYEHAIDAQGSEPGNALPPANVPGLSTMPCSALTMQIATATNIGMADGMNQVDAFRSGRAQFNAMNARARQNFAAAGAAKRAGAKGAAIVLAKKGGAELRAEAPGLSQTARNIKAATPRIGADMNVLAALTGEYDRRCGSIPGASGAPGPSSSDAMPETAAAAPADTSYAGSPQCANLPAAAQVRCETLLKSKVRRR